MRGQGAAARGPACGESSICLPRPTLAPRHACLGGNYLPADDLFSNDSRMVDGLFADLCGGESALSGPPFLKLPSTLSPASLPRFPLFPLYHYRTPLMAVMLICISASSASRSYPVGGLASCETTPARSCSDCLLDAEELLPSTAAAILPTKSTHEATAIRSCCKAAALLQPSPG